MSANFSRREFLFASTTATLGAVAPGASFLAQPASPATEAAPIPPKNISPYSTPELFKKGPQRSYSGDSATQVAMPIGGIGTGCICLNGYGGLQDFSIRHRPATTALPVGFNYSDAGFALLHFPGENPLTRLLEGPLPAFKIYDQGLQGQGCRHSGHEGFPRCDRSIFKGEFPFGEVTLTDGKMPLQVRISGWNPFVPLDDKNSGIPCAILEYSLHNVSTRSVEYQFSYHLAHMAPGCTGEEAASRSRPSAEGGIFFFNAEKSNAEGFGSACLMAIGQKAAIKAMWLRSPGWEFDSLSALWREVSAGKFTANEGSNEIDTKGRNGGSLLLKGRLAPAASITYPILITWHFPNAYLRAGGFPNPDEKAITGEANCRTLPEPAQPPWRPYYAGRWKDAEEVALYVSAHFDSLKKRTVAFQRALFDSTLPAHVLDAVSANLAILKSPTVLRQGNGNLWGWEGCFPDSGCCPGSCTHVWNYAQAFPHLFPALERTLREQELERSMDESGHVTFRSTLPDGPAKHDFHAASDGQLGGIMKVYRDWQISGDSAWLKKIYPLAKHSLDYCIRTWDPDHKGGLFEPHHNTYDIEFWGPDGMCTSIYLGALSAMAQMAQAIGKTEDASFYENLSRSCARFMDEELFNGDFYRQKIEYANLRNQSFAQMVAKVDENSSEMQKLLKREGPKYQYGSGCLSDGVIGAWMANIYGIETPLARENVRKALHSIFKNNFKTDLSEHANAQRPGYALGHEPGLLLCSWPKGGKPTLPFVYSDEVWTGIEYQVASHLIAEGFVEEGLTIVKAVRSRYDGKVRNPWNEYECGNYYARAMSSYALLGALSGFRYSAVSKTLWFGPRLDIRPFHSFFSTATGYGTITLDSTWMRIALLEGNLEVNTVIYNLRGTQKKLSCNLNVRPEAAATITL